jgi:catechol 2,3-dioxygenase-like lactoylglutathione lyase family enzyme
MSLASLKPIGFIPTQNPSVAREFYEKTLGLSLVKEDGFALVFEIGPHKQMLRVVTAQNFEPLPFTLFGWEVDDIHATISELSANGVEFLRFSFFKQDDAGVWAAPDGSLVAWFKDPDGNTLSLSHHAG